MGELLGKGVYSEVRKVTKTSTGEIGAIKNTKGSWCCNSTFSSRNIISKKCFRMHVIRDYQRFGIWYVWRQIQALF